MLRALRELWAGCRPRSKYTCCALFINGQESSPENEIDFIHLGFYTPLHNHNPANFSLREIITLMKIKYNLKSAFIFIYLMPVRINLKWLGEWEEMGFSRRSPRIFADGSELTHILLFLSLHPLVPPTSCPNPSQLGGVWSRRQESSSYYPGCSAAYEKPYRWWVYGGKALSSQKGWASFKSSLPLWNGACLLHLSKIESQGGQSIPRYHSPLPVA